MFILCNPVILEYLNTQDISELYFLNNSYYSYLSSIKAVKSSIWRGDLPSKIRAKFWIYQCPIYK